MYITIISQSQDVYTLIALVCFPVVAHFMFNIYITECVSRRDMFIH